MELLNGTEYFNVDSDGVVLVKPNVKIDREEISEIVIKARLQVYFEYIFFYQLFNIVLNKI